MTIARARAWHGRATEVVHRLDRHRRVDRLCEIGRVLLPDLRSDVRRESVREVVHLISVAHVDDRCHGVLKHADVLIHRLAAAQAQLPKALTCDHRSLHRAEAVVEATDEVVPRRARRLMLPPVRRGTSEERDREANLTSVIREARPVVRELLLQLTQPIVDSESHRTAERRRLTDLREERTRGRRRGRRGGRRLLRRLLRMRQLRGLLLHLRVQLLHLLLHLHQHRLLG